MSIDTKLHEVLNDFAARRSRLILIVAASLSITSCGMDHLSGEIFLIRADADVKVDDDSAGKSSDISDRSSTAERPKD